jgi:adenylate cyclase
MAEDEQATLATLTEYRSVMGNLIAQHRGRVIDAPGDALLAEFASAVEAVQCAVEIQRDLAGRNAQLPESRRMLVRIGVNLGDVIEQGGGLYGDGVNIAARLEGLADPGGVCVSGTVFDQVEGKVYVGFRYAGEQTVKNIAKPLRTYHAQLGTKTLRKTRPARRALILAAALMLSALATIAFWQLRDHGAKWEQHDAMLAMPNGPVIAVLPFTSIGGDPEQDHFGDGLTEDIITELARFRDLHVLARNTTFQFKGKAVDVSAVGRKLGARYVLEGSVRRSGGQLRVTAQLIDSTTGAHLWAERYDRDVRDIFAIQDEITGRIVASMMGSDVSVLKRAQMRSGSRHPADLQAYEHVLRGSLFDYDWTKESYALAKEHLQKAIQLAPDYARARQQYAYTLLIGWISGLEQNPVAPAEIKENAIHSVKLDPTDHRAHRTAAVGYFFDHQLDLFEREAEIAIQMAPYDAQVLAELGFLFLCTGQWDRGIALVRKSQALNPGLASGWYHTAMHYDYFKRGMYKEALEIVRAHPSQHLIHTQWKYVAAYAALGELDKARAHWAKCLELDPNWSADEMIRQFELWNWPKAFADEYVRTFGKLGYFPSGRGT